MTTSPNTAPGDHLARGGEHRGLPEVASRPEVSQFIRVSVPTLARWAAEGRGPKFRKAGSRCLYFRSDVLAWLQALDTGGEVD